MYIVTVEMGDTTSTVRSSFLSTSEQIIYGGVTIDCDRDSSPSTKQVHKTSWLLILQPTLCIC